MAKSPKKAALALPVHHVMQDTQASRSASTINSWLDRVWSFFSAPRLALVLILLLAGASLVGVLLAQAPAGAQSDPQAYGRWLAQIGNKYGAATEIFSRLGLFTVFDAWWFRLLLALLVSNILICSISRGGRLVRAALARPHVTMPEPFFAKAKLQARIEVHGLPFAQAEPLLRSALRASGYRVLIDRRADSVYAYADRNRLAPLGTLLHHLSLVVLLFGFFVGSVWGFEDSGFVVAEGATRAIGNTGLAVHLDAFFDEYYPEGPPKDYRSHVVLYEQGQEVKRDVVRVNSPLTYGGIRLHQSFFGSAVMMEVREPSGALVASETVPLAWRSQDRPVGSFLIQSRNLEVFVVGPASSFVDPVIPPGQVRIEAYRIGDAAPQGIFNVLQGKGQTERGLVYTFVRERLFSGFKVVNNPGRPFLWAGAIGIVLGLTWVLYFPGRQLWAMAQRQSDGGMMVHLGAAKGKRESFSGEFKSAAKRLEQAATRAGGETQASVQEAP